MKYRFTGREKRLLLYVSILVIVLAWDTWRRRWTPAITLETEHFRIQSSATAEQTDEAGLAEKRVTHEK